ncbi:hypothetical protein [Ruegeria sp. HKCCD6109]|uniref:hypothetical protein n=1 Tax=Ruegeria sp. HKCCD6109 TaxID=2683017 RepID=UPI0014922CE2|nr:hypothetical protein [Ruegeria sp. HKCCD6109]NOD65740.1 hypothetical protein [Ruegeria sp. HKCCD6109]
MGFSAVIGGVTGLLGAAGARSAGKSQENAALAQAEVARETRDIMRRDLAPYRQVGTPAVNALSFEAGLTDIAPDGYQAFEFEKTPGYDFRLNEGLRAVESGVAARQGLNSGAAMKALTRYGQDYGANAFNSERAFHFGQLNNLANIGQSAAAGSANAAATAGQMQTNALGNLGNAQAATSIGVGNALASGLNNGLGVWAYNQNRNALQ